MELVGHTVFVRCITCFIRQKASSRRLRTSEKDKNGQSRVLSRTGCCSHLFVKAVSPPESGSACRWQGERSQRMRLEKTIATGPMHGSHGIVQKRTRLQALAHKKALRSSSTTNPLPTHQRGT